MIARSCQCTGIVNLANLNYESLPIPGAWGLKAGLRPWRSKCFHCGGRVSDKDLAQSAWAVSPEFEFWRLDTAYTEIFLQVPTIGANLTFLESQGCRTAIHDSGSQIQYVPARTLSAKWTFLESKLWSLGVWVWNFAGQQSKSEDGICRNENWRLVNKDIVVL